MKRNLTSADSEVEGGRATSRVPTHSTRIADCARMFDLDNYRIFLTSLVILHQAALAYGGSGAWAVVEGATDSVTPLILSTFNTVNQSFFVSAVKFVLTGTVTIAICFLIATLLRAISGTRPVLGKGGDEGGGYTRTLTLPDRARYGLLP